VLIIGLDPGLACTGWGVIAADGNRLSHVANGQVRYFLGQSGHGGPSWHRTGSAADISAWVEKTFTKTDVGGTTVYDLQSPRS
jgi:hypothetical protein